MLGFERLIGKRPGSEIQKKPDVSKQETAAVPERAIKPEDIETRRHSSEVFFTNLEGVFERWKATQKSGQEIRGTFGLIVEKASTLERLYLNGGTDFTHLSGAFERFEKQVEQLEEEVKFYSKESGELGELPTQKQEVEDLKEWRGRILAVLSDQQLAGKMSPADFEMANKAFEAFERATDAEKAFKPHPPEPREIELEKSFLLAAQLLIKRLKPEIEEFKQRMEGNRTVEQRLKGVYDERGALREKGLYAERDEIRERLAGMESPEVAETHPRISGPLDQDVKDKYNKQRLSAYEREQKSLLRAFEQVSAKISDIEAQAKTERISLADLDKKSNPAVSASSAKKKRPRVEDTVRMNVPPAA